MNPWTASALFLVFLLLAIAGTAVRCLGLFRPAPPYVRIASAPSKPAHDKLFVLVHGFRGGTQAGKAAMASVQAALAPHGDVLSLTYPTRPWTNLDPEEIAADMQRKIAEVGAPYDKIVLLGHSMGALLVRRALLDDATRAQPVWSQKVTRVVLLAGMNRGWDLDGPTPADMNIETRIKFTIGTWVGKLANVGSLIAGVRKGEPFVANLRVDWLKAALHTRLAELQIVQLLGDIDDMVSPEDSQDLRVTATRNFAWIRVRGTNHFNIIDLRDQSSTSAEDNGTFSVGQYRRDKLLLAATGPWSDVMAQSEEQRSEPDTSVKHVVFVLHGIRDLGEWSAQFEETLKGGTSQQAVRVVSARYGYFGMGQFLLYADREKYVRWFMDQYTETLARYPAATRIDFFGHSNGTYLLGRALERYRSMRIDHVVVAGSVLRKDFDWQTLLSSRRVKSLRNYVAADDWVVGLFPRFFELPVIDGLLKNNVGSAGLNGFTQLDSQTGLNGRNIRYLHGGHSAFLGSVAEISNYFITDGQVTNGAAATPFPDNRLLQLGSDWLVPALWLLLAFGVLWVGIQVMGAAGATGSGVAFILYVFSVILLLRWV